MTPRSSPELEQPPSAHWHQDTRWKRALGERGRLSTSTAAGRMLWGRHRHSHAVLLAKASAFTASADEFFMIGRGRQKGGDPLRNIKQQLNYCPDAAGMRN